MRNSLGNHAHAERLANFRMRNTLALRGRFNASVACITKQRGCSSEGMEKTIVIVDCHL